MLLLLILAVILVLLLLVDGVDCIPFFIESLRNRSSEAEPLLLVAWDDDGGTAILNHNKREKGTEIDPCSARRFYKGLQRG